MTVEQAHAEFTAVVDVPDGELDLTRAALAIAQPEYDSLDTDECIGQLRALAHEAGLQLSGSSTALHRIARLNEFLYLEKGFVGNRSDYYDERNSYINEVITRRTGIPITLAIVYMDISARLALDVRGVGFPGHFLIKCVDQGEIVVDPFTGEILSRQECEQRFRALAGQEAQFDPSVLAETGKRQILARVLGNLKQIHLHHGALERALQCVERILLLDANNPAEVRDRGLILAGLKQFPAATAELERFLRLAPTDPSAPLVRSQLEGLRGRGRTLH